jgi:hypothetical protein
LVVVLDHDDRQVTGLQQVNLRFETTPLSLYEWRIRRRVSWTMMMVLESQSPLWSRFRYQLPFAVADVGRSLSDKYIREIVKNVVFDFTNKFFQDRRNIAEIISQKIISAVQHRIKIEEGINHVLIYNCQLYIF